MFDYLIIGSGIIGSFLARDLTKYQLKVGILEKESDVANVASMANSAIVHSGHDPRDGTLKAKLNVLGSRMYEKICQELNVGYRKCGAFVCETTDSDFKKLPQLYQQACERNIPVEILNREEALKLEPNLSDNVTRVLSLPSTAVVYPWEVAIACMECALNNGAKLYLNNQVEKIVKVDDHFIVSTNKGSYQTKNIINAAGIYADEIYRMISDSVNFKIEPRKGEYYVLDKEAKDYVKRVIYPIPGPSGKGVLVVPTTHNNILVGPNSFKVNGDYGNNNTKEGIDFVAQQVKKTVKNVPFNHVIRTFAGLRPSTKLHDFVIEKASDVDGFINVAAIESPGLASAPAISQMVISELIEANKCYTLKENYNPIVEPYIVLNNKSFEEKNRYVDEDPRFGHIVCRCEEVSEGEVVAAINRVCGATTIKGVKKRIRPGMGRCQGGFCEPKIAEILARELGVKMTDVLYDGEDSNILSSESKV